ncbi:hypothetical protein F8388_007196 [Cannabis sativa]|uniref:LysM domain-containing protein n=1 Tax=Cannabis sativa TaxID=3483 RepID=A0A7J6EIW8_CANSA|nr:hypothetical protein F8388_007196 [Cannabis sativa]
MGSATCPAILLSLFFISAHLVAQSAAQTPPTFTCSKKATCQALVDYVVPNATTLDGIQTLFGIKKLYSLLGANGRPTSTPRTAPVAAKETIKIPFRCICKNGTGVSNRVPTYTVKKGDGLDHIARDIFSTLVSYQQIAAVNGIKDVNLIEVGQKLWIPLPCSCDDFNGTQVVHYGHVVQAGNSMEGIAQDFGTTEEALLKLNGIANSSELMAGQVLDVPLKVCASSMRNGSLDNPILLPNGTYVVTAYDCVKCSCDSSNNWTLQCEAAQVKLTNKKPWSTCPSMQCSESNLALGITSTTDSTCTTCSYAGFNNQTIFTQLLNQSTCSATNSNNNNAASKMGVGAWSWNYLFISVHLVLISVGLGL